MSVNLSLRSKEFFVILYCLSKIFLNSIPVTFIVQLLKSISNGEIFLDDLQSCMHPG